MADIFYSEVHDESSSNISGESDVSRALKELTGKNYHTNNLEDLLVILLTEVKDLRDKVRALESKNARYK